MLPYIAAAAVAGIVLITPVASVVFHPMWFREQEHYIIYDRWAKNEETEADKVFTVIENHNQTKRMHRLPPKGTHVRMELQF